jgi:hypothetical protein
MVECNKMKKSNDSSFEYLGSDSERGSFGAQNANDDEGDSPNLNLVSAREYQSGYIPNAFLEGKIEKLSAQSLLVGW